MGTSRKELSRSASVKFLKVGRFYAMVDADVFAWASKWLWGARKNSNGHGWYVMRNESSLICKKRSSVMLHREILRRKYPNLDNLETDHINGDGLDNRLANLRVATHAGNMRNRAKFKMKCTSRFKGVHWHRRMKRFQAHININGKFTYLGTFKSERKAARAYDRAAKQYHGEFARLNFDER